MPINPFVPQSFKDKMEGGVRPSFFVATISYERFFPQDHIYFVRMAELPGVYLTTPKLHYQGREIGIPGTKRFEPVRLTFINDPKFSIRSSIEKWMNLLNETKENSRSDRSLTSLTGDITITQFSHQAEFGTATSAIGGLLNTTTVARAITSVMPPKKLKRYRFVNCYPTTLDPIVLDHDKSDEFEVFGAQFVYQYYEEDHVTKLEAAIISAVKTIFGF